MIDVEISGPGIPRLSRSAVRDFVRRALRAIQRAGAATLDPEEVSIAFVDDGEMRRLNRGFRGRKQTTDVLTFEGDAESQIPDAPRFLGEIVISVDQAKRQAAAQRHSLATEIRYLLLHGLLHAFGYDHETDDGEMDALEMAIRRRVGLP
ncbi:MAG TPA: rRNA maturation RNase YbeY [Thermoanaerobaculia bacterium]|nr:rRNA maturation RNase YbeY [Thermoanaerobaculia bacterium]